MTLLLEIITPERVVYKNEVDEVIIPTVSGEITVLPQHTYLVTKIKPGELTIKKGNSVQLMAITGGFLEVGDNKITILADYAIRAEEVEIAKAQEAQKRAEKIMKEKITEEDFAKAEADLRRSLLELKVALKHRRGAPR